MEHPKTWYQHLLLPSLSCPLASGVSSLVSRPVIYDTGTGLGEAALCLKIAPPLAINGRGSSELCGEKLALVTRASVWETLLPVVFSVQALLLWVSLLSSDVVFGRPQSMVQLHLLSQIQSKLLPAGIPDMTNQGIPPKVCLSLTGLC